MPFVSASIYHKATRLAQQEGLLLESLVHHAESKELKEGSKYIPIELLYDVYELAEQQLQPGFGLRQGKQLESDDYGTLGLSWRTCWLAREVLDRLERYMVLVTDHGSISIFEEGGFTRLTLVRDAFRKGLEIANEASFVMINQVLREVTGKDIYPTEVCFKHRSNESVAFSDYFNCEVVFDASDYSIVYKTEELNIPTIKADRSIQKFLDERMDEEKKGIHSNMDVLLTDLHKLIEESLPSGIPSIIQVAEYLGMSGRTLKRRLSDKGLTFRDYVQKIQREMSLQLLTSSSQSMSEIAFQTGFSEQSAFNRAFKRWMGQSPVDYRRSA